jgi:hypothetical protein
MNREAGKGSKPRQGADQQAFERGWDRIFGKKEKPVRIKKHTCPYREEIYGDHATLCDCDHEATWQCSQNI